jgi:hypothetical protein
MPALTGHRQEECWLIHYGDVHVGTIAERTGNPHERAFRRFKPRGRLLTVDPKIIELFPRLKLFGQPAWLLSAARPGFRRLFRISEFWENSWIRLALRSFEL